MTTGYGSKYRIESARWSPGVSIGMSNCLLGGAAINHAVFEGRNGQDWVFKVRGGINNRYRKRLL